jgi:predicted transcriptional regulator
MVHRMRRTTLFISIRPTFANKILSGVKTIELRRVRPSIAPGDTVLIYSTSPVMALLGSAKVDEILSGTPRKIWGQVKEHAGVSCEEFNEYFSGAAIAIGIRLCAIQRLSEPISLRELRKRWPWLRPPQSYRYVDARLGPEGEAVKFLAPSN